MRAVPFLRRHAAGLAVVALLAGGGLTGCAIPLELQQAAERVEQASLPRTRAKTLATVLKLTKDGLGAEYAAKRVTAAELAATKPAVDRATAALDQAGDLLTEAEADKQLADVTEDALKKAAYSASSAANEALANRRMDAAEADMKPLRDLLNRVRGVS